VQKRVFCIIFGACFVFTRIFIVKLTYSLSQTDVNTCARNCWRQCWDWIAEAEWKFILNTLQSVPVRSSLCTYWVIQCYLCIAHLFSCCWLRRFWLFYWLACSMWYVFTHVLSLFIGCFVCYTLPAYAVTHNKCITITAVSIAVLMQ